MGLKLSLAAFLVVSSGGDDTEQLFREALAKHQSGDATGALAAYRRVIASGVLSRKALTMAYTNAGALELALGDEAQAGYLLSLAAATNPTNAAAHANECVFWASRNATRARPSCARTLQLDANHEAAALALAEIDGHDAVRQSRPPLSVEAIEARFGDLERLFTSGPPFVWRKRHALSAAECHDLIATGDRLGWRPSETTGDAAWRHSESVAVAWEAASPLDGASGGVRDTAETPQLVRYPAQGFFGPHSDAHDYYARRELTWLFYLDDADCPTHFPFAPNGTSDPNFPRFDLAAALDRVHPDRGLLIHPARGDALLFVNVDLETRSRPDALAMHVRPCSARRNFYSCAQAATPCATAGKHVANVWFRFPDADVAVEVGISN